LGTPILRFRRASRRTRAACVLPLLGLLGLALPPSPARSASNARIQVDGRTITVPDSDATTVRELLAEARVTVDGDDEVSPDLDAPVRVDGLVRIQRVKYVESAVDIKLPYRTIVRSASPGNRPYHPTVTREGRSGLKRITYRTRVVDGQELERTTQGETIVREPVHEIVTSRKPYLLGSRGAYAGRRSLTMLSSAYDPGFGSCGKWARYGRTCNGKRAGYGVIAVDPKVIPLGAKLFVPGYGYGVAADVGGAIKGNRIDLGFNSRAGAIQWGKRQVMVRIVD
jgi:resuscitation-promoting factor RpfB